MPKRTKAPVATAQRGTVLNNTYLQQHFCQITLNKRPNTTRYNTPHTLSALPNWQARMILQTAPSRSRQKLCTYAHDVLTGSDCPTKSFIESLSATAHIQLIPHCREMSALICLLTSHLASFYTSVFGRSLIPAWPSCIKRRDL